MEELKRDELKRRWVELVGSGEEAEKAFASIVAKYSEAGRFYHGLRHIWQVLETLDTLKAGARNWQAVQFAAYYHDVVYDTRAKDNEEQSAEFARQALARLGIALPAIEETGRLIRATKAHQAGPDDTDAQLLLDADLAILGTEPPVYAQYAAAIRQEYGWVEEAAYRAGRRQVLEKFLERERLYFTPEMYAQAEAQARQNLARETSDLS